LETIEGYHNEGVKEKKQIPVDKEIVLPLMRWVTSGELLEIPLSLLKIVKTTLINNAIKFSGYHQCPSLSSGQNSMVDSRDWMNGPFVVA
jgi:hypothetical protein